MKTFRIALMAALLAGPAHAQSLGTSIIPETPSKTPDQIEREQALERDYKESLKKIPNGKASNDPWGSVRSAEPSRASAKAPAAKTAPAKTGQAKAAKTTQAKPAGNVQ
ncbi:hypothetical protein [Bradyrhizobium prioriisuperbiae]|uniref:hypothetical protein n=1 Tax=Bradyrhizobium prioriisuperbiae TaxID=2854389 RepID=UPI0028EC42A6|nr:hypothetical protein [Bradyrhizobium prioritasuperba]